MCELLRLIASIWRSQITLIKASEHCKICTAPPSSHRILLLFFTFPTIVIPQFPFNCPQTQCAPSLPQPQTQHRPPPLTLQQALSRTPPHPTSNKVRAEKTVNSEVIKQRWYIETLHQHYTNQGFHLLILLTCLANSYSQKWKRFWKSRSVLPKRWCSVFCTPCYCKPGFRSQHRLQLWLIHSYALLDQLSLSQKP